MGRTLEFKDIGDWTPSTVSIVDVPYHPLAYFEVYENDEEFVKKFQEIEVKEMPNGQQNSENSVTMSEGFFEKLFGGLVAKRNPEPTPQNNAPQPPEPPANKDGDEEVTNAEILEAIQKIDGRVTKLENGTDPEPPEPPANDDGDEGGEGDEGGDPTPQTVELPLNPDGTLDMTNAVVAKYIPRGTSQSQAIDGDIVRGQTPDKSLNERTGRNENGMNW